MKIYSYPKDLVTKEKLTEATMKQEPCPECGKTEPTCYRCFMGEPTPDGWNNITKIPEKDGMYRTLCLVGSMSPKLREFHGDWYKNGTWRSFDWSRVLAWK